MIFFTKIRPSLFVIKALANKEARLKALRASTSSAILFIFFTMIDDLISMHPFSLCNTISMCTLDTDIIEALLGVFGIRDIKAKKFNGIQDIKEKNQWDFLKQISVDTE